MNINKIFFSLLLIVIIYGCNKNLTQPISDTQAASSVSTTADILKVLQGTYGIFQNQSLYKEELIKLILLCADDFTSATNQFQIYSEKIYNSSSPSIENAYSSYYQIINNCNFILSALPPIKTTSGTDSTLKVKEDGETRFFRAFSYFDLVRLFGSIPIRTQPSTINTNFYTSRSSVDSVYALIFSDLAIASNELNYKSSSDGIGLTNKGATLSLQALAYLTYANYLDRIGSNGMPYYTSADSCAKLVISKGGYSLVPNYADLWNVNNESNNYGSEVIFGIRFTRDAQVASTASQGSGYASRFSPSTMAGVCGNTTKGANGLGTGAGTYRIEPWFYNYYTSGDYLIDKRATATFMTTWRKAPTSGSMYVSYPNPPTYYSTVNGVKILIDSLPSPEPFIQKYQDPQGLDAADNENDMFIFRLSEIYLIEAEAENELSTSGPPSTAISAFNKVRTRAGNTVLLPTSGLSQNTFRKKIFDERGLEFVGECKRWFDLVRMKGADSTGLLFPTMYQYQFNKYLPTLPSGLPSINLVQKVWLTTSPGGVTDPYSIIPYNSKFLLFPIPQAEIDENPMLLPNNPGW